jgi:coenzyme F420 biosynthesis associated uncharacterized protein
VSLSVDWATARRVAARIGTSENDVDRDDLARLATDMVSLTSQAEELVAAETGLVSLAGPARGRVTDRAGWVDANLASFDRLTRPLLDKLNEPDDDDPSRIGAALSRAIEPVASKVGPKLAGAEVGALLGWMSGRVIGQYDLLIIEDENPEAQDIVYYVGPNVMSMEERYGFPPSEFRLWIAIHECTHRAQFTAVPWLRPYFLSLVNELMDDVDPDPTRFIEAAKSAIEKKRAGMEGLTDGGLQHLLASPKQRETLDKVSGLMSLLEGHGDITMDRAGRHLIPSQPRFARVFTKRRNSASGPTKVLQRLLGFEAKLAQYEEGEKFIHAVEAAGGRELFDQVWSGPDALPAIDEIRLPELWISRMTASTGS